MSKVIKIFSIISLWLLYGGMLTLAIIFDGIYIQVVIDTSIMVLSAVAGYLYKASRSKNES